MEESWRFSRKRPTFAKSSSASTSRSRRLWLGTRTSADYALPDGCVLTGEPNDVVDDPSIDMVVEEGGTTLAKEVVVKSLKAGKHVVTANKALIAQDLPEIDGLLKSVNTDRETPVQFGFEAAVCGGIPIIHALQRDFIGDEVKQLSGIINGCTNFILSNMAMGGLSYADARRASAPLRGGGSADVGGFDSMNFAS